MIEQITESQIEQIKHALGLDRSDKPTRNIFYTESDDKDWNGLVDKGYATKRTDKGWDEDSAYFFVTDEGKALISK